LALIYFASESAESGRRGSFPLSDFVMLACAVLAALAAGVLVAYGVCLGVFGLFRMRAKQAAAEAPVRVASGAKVVEG
jgi:hypothetical protein